MALLEDTLLADGREWVLGGGGGGDGGGSEGARKGPTLADIEAVWVLHWMIGIPGALFDAGYVSAERFPRVYAWVARFQAAVGAAKAGVVVKGMSGEEAAVVLKGQREGVGYFEKEGEVDAADPIVKVYGLEKGSRVEVWPTDSGAGHRDQGCLVSLDAEEIVWETDAGVRVHAPRHGFRVRLARPVEEVGV
ncbi:hypothetical protein CHGG_00634 [Chaetomium globosum CBS 148.51]|uniref:DUF7962 domain-containing protein n=1 Tax=Chaetomium globosum (strain ATCC 6205 / CBS 148.51 / DSM 1962 / NBRC 6347 / NRRL 1970) TaxID=306901 RepID=Q2HGM0_CHAGB|nr:uncharacterized protein CHGG_00634 [Chaetomium globosum CBS 148.51]EAQ92399.1 hypothetical protein CHGG_00634 [Chaetomium globosum CBS 148.51]